MKTIFFILLAIPCFAQMDSLPNLKGTLYWIPEGTKPVKEPDFALLKFKLNRATSVALQGGYAVTYIPESDDHESNKLGTRIRLIVQQVPYNALLTSAQMQQITDLINSFVTSTEPPIVQVDTVDSEGLTFSTDWQRKGLTSAAGWYNKTIAYSNVGQVSYKFTGTRLQIYGETKPTDGTGSIVIGSKTATIFYNKPQALQTLVYDSGVMPSGEYTFVLRPLLGSINVDFIVVHK